MRIAAVVVLASILSAGVPSTAAESPFRAFGEYFVRDGGVWEMPNAAYTPGGDQPRVWRMEHEWAANEQHLRARIVSRLDDGREIVNWHIYTMWHPAERRLIYYQIARDGTLGIGHVETIDENSIRADMRLMQPTGEEQMVRHLFEVQGPDAYESTVQVQEEDGSWRTVTTSVWTRLKQTDAS